MAGYARRVRVGALFRRGNDVIARTAVRAGIHEEEIDFICECDDERCLQSVPLTPADYRRRSALGPGSIVVSGHASRGATSMSEVDVGPLAPQLEDGNAEREST